MLIDSPEKIQKRKQHFERQKIAQVMGMKDKKKAAYILQRFYDMDCDYTPGQDDGEGPKQ